MKNIYIMLMVLVISPILFAQNQMPPLPSSTNEQDSIQKRKMEIVALVDSLNSIEMYDEDFYNLNDQGEIEMYEVNFAGLPVFYNKLDEAFYYYLKKKTYNAYPYYLEIVRNYENFKDSVQIFENNRKMRRYFKNRQKELADEYEEKLKKLTRMEGQILSKLVYRRTEKTTYEVIQELRGSFNAFLWETKAGFFDISLKTEFDPYNVREDFFINNIIYRGINSGELKSENYIDL